MALFAIPKVLQGPEELNVEGPKVIKTFEIFGLKINFTETVVLEWIVMAVILLVAFLLTRNLKVRKVSKRQAIAEMAVEAITNLVKNAIEHSGEGKSVILRAEDTSLFVKIRVEDEGEGISEKDLPHIFERFYQAEGSAEGSIGIGLAFARTIVERENGMITVDSEKGRGSVFTVRYWK